MQFEPRRNEHFAQKDWLEWSVGSGRKDNGSLIYQNYEYEPRPHSAPLDAENAGTPGMERPPLNAAVCVGSGLV